MPPQPVIVPDPPRPPAIAPLELERLRGAVRATLFDRPAVLPTVGRYTLLRCIGHGGMGIVYAARDEELGREVAIKVLRAELAREDDQRLAHEARALARLSHPNVVCVFDVGIHEGQRFIAMEYILGDNLRRWLAAPRSLGEVLRVFVGAGRGLHAAHTVGLVHRDFKPDNVLVGDDGRPRVLDFGLARPPDAPRPGEPPRPPVLPAGIDPFGTALTSAGQVLGTPAYMAPEQYLGEPADARSDQFSFAVALYHAVYGERPFAGEDPHELALSIVRGRLQPVAPRYSVPGWLEQLLERALRVDPAQRFASMDALVAVLEQHLERGSSTELEALPSRAFAPGRLGQGEHAAQGLTLNEPWGLTGSFEVGTPLPATVADARGPTQLALPPEVQLDGVVMSLATRRTLPTRLSEAALGRVVGELERVEGRRGKIVRIGSGLTWSTPALEVHLDLDGSATQLLVWRRLAPSLRSRTVQWTLLGFLAGALAIPIAEGFGWLGNGLEAAVVFGLLGMGSFLGFRTARDRHERALPVHRAQLEFIADRLLVVAAAQPAALGGEPY